MFTSTIMYYCVKHNLANCEADARKTNTTHWLLHLQQTFDYMFTSSEVYTKTFPLRCDLWVQILNLHMLHYFLNFADCQRSMWRNAHLDEWHMALFRRLPWKSDLHGTKTHDIFSHKSGTRLVQVWYKFGTRLVQVWYTAGTSLVQVRYKFGTSL